MADMLDLRGLTRDVDDEASLGGLQVVDDVLSELLEIAESGGVAEGLEGIVGNDLDDLGHEGARVGQQARVLEDGGDDLLGGINGHSFGLGGAVLDEDLGDLELDLVTLLGIVLEAVEIDVDRQLRDVDARLGGSRGSREGAGAGVAACAGTAMRAVPVARAAAAPAATRRFLIMVCPLLSMSRHLMRCSHRLCPADTT